MLRHCSYDLQVMFIAANGWIVVVKGNQFKDLSPLEVDATNTIFFECGLFVRVFSGHKISGAWCYIRVNANAISSTELREH